MNESPRDDPGSIEEEMILESLAALKVVSDPLRLRLLERLAEPRTVKELADELGVAPTKLYYHMGLLERHGLIRVVGTRLVSGILEKRYRVAARRLRVAPPLLTFAVAADRDDDSLGLISTVFANTEAEIGESLRSGAIDPESKPPRHDALFFLRTNGKLTAERAEAFSARLQILVDEFERTDWEPADPASRSYGLTLALYPMSSGHDQGQPQDPPPSAR